METGKRSLFLMTMLMLCVLLACKALSKDDGEKMGVPQTVSDGTWTVVSATDLGKTLPALPDFASIAQPRTTAGRFVKVHYMAQPKSEAFSVMYPPVIVDSQGREHKPIDDYKYVTGDTAFDVAVGQSGEVKPVYEVPPDAKDLKAKLAGNRKQDGIPVMVNLEL